MAIDVAFQQMVKKLDSRGCIAFGSMAGFYFNAKMIAYFTQAIAFKARQYFSAEAHRT
jgi:hypothetical protein